MRVVGQPSFFLVVFALSCTPVKKENITTRIDSLWHAPDTANIPNDLTRYGRKLIANTSFYLGPKGIVDSISNGMNCQNCHLDAGTRPYGNNFGSVASLYPKFRARSGGAESVEKRVNDCIQRSLNGKPLDSLSKEMRALVAYITWVGHEVPKGTKAKGSGLIEIKFLNRSADPVRGKKLYETQCRVCHQKNGQGMIASNEKSYVYPPLWGTHSFNTGAGLFRISNFAKYIRANMPQGATYDNPILTEEESWDIAAFVVSMPRPKKNFKSDWPRIETKPFDHPFGPYADTLSETSHKYGPWKNSK
ncbi:MAG: c-type cytochrome [Cytophagales bacterium]|nr:c-type cytochrome [Cytophagales bacterium]MCA6367903.1 c-type cytochrome [Cytophagales bacterium]MCA6370073.1 c-type cytochrome [Cytophagales bacterium]MCA6374483.1 c-type cytochrome [Cytophagales bacterium]MCA6383370.1 c-type cytochrome [Cytophagales bacterium]